MIRARRPGPAGLALLLAAAGCNQEYPNPFEGSRRSIPPPAGAAIVFTTAAWSTTPGGREVFSIAADGSNPTRLTFCNTQTQACDTDIAALSPEGRRAAMTRVVAGVSGASLVYSDLTRGVEADLVAPANLVTGLDWSANTPDDLLAYSATGAGGLEDLFRLLLAGQQIDNLTSTPTVRERKPRIDLATTIVAYERIEGAGKAEVFIFVSTNQLTRISAEGPGGAPLSGTPYLVGSDADPGFSPDARALVFRRLTSTVPNGLGTWDIVTARRPDPQANPPVTADATTLVSGPLYRGAPDWGSGGIVFPEVDPVARTASIVLIQPDGSGRRVLYSQGANFALGNPRWLRQVAP
jgi:hypothetical protein